MAISVRMPKTQHQKGKAWATTTLVFCGAFSIWANVRSGQIETENVIVSIVPPIVAFLTSHLIAYFNPRSWVGYVGIYGFLGAVCLVAMYGSGWHIFDYVTRNGQHWTTGISYIFITDAPMLLAAIILTGKVSTTTKVTTSGAKRTSEAIKHNLTQTPPKKTTPSKSTPAKTTAAKATTPRKTTKPAKVPDILLDPFERDMLDV